MTKKKQVVVNNFAVTNFFALNGKNGIIFLEIPPKETAGSQNTFKYVNTLELEELQFCNTLVIINSHDKNDKDYIYSYKHNELYEVAN